MASRVNARAFLPLRSLLPRSPFLCSSLALTLALALAASAPGAASASDDLVIIRADRKIDLQSHVVRFMISFKAENVGQSPVGRILVALTPEQNTTLAFASVVLVSGKAKSRSFQVLDGELLKEGEGDAPPASDPALGLLFLGFPLPPSSPLAPGATAQFEVYLSFLALATPFPAEITQSESQLLLLYDNSYLLSPYKVRMQSTLVKLPSSRVDRFTAAEPSRKVEAELRLGPYENVEPFATSPLVVHFESNKPLPVAASLVRELEVSHWGNVYVTEDYDIVHEGAKLKGIFSRLELQMRPHSSGLSSLKGLVAALPKDVRAVYFRDEIGNISTSNLRHESRRAVIELSPRYPLFGGWHTTFTLGYSVPLSQLVFTQPDGTRMLNTSFGTTFQELPIRSLTVKVVLPEGSYGIHTDAPFPLDNKRSEKKYSYLDTVGRPVVVLEKANVVQEHSLQHFQVSYSFSPLFLLAEPLLLVAAFALFFFACAVYVRLDLTIAKSAPAYQAKLQTDKLMDAVQRLQSAVLLRMGCVEALDKSLVRLGRTGDVGAAKADKKAQEEKVKEYGQMTKADKKAQEEKVKEYGQMIKDALAAIESLPKAPKALALAQQIVAKDKEYVEKAVKRHNISVEAYEKKLTEKEIEEAVAPLVERLNTLRLELKALLITLDD